ncbi:hypothetical protein SNE26_24190 [Mucilaginibacter sp. cycad4]|uniref:hypothetical protein n=1 Tax=Mucilaginibacter sp. cycad4 TaxID=3342096 RepID=UPI002AAB5ABA|nr:hypothetical protein [Mucilaginibacter gossypii]WPU99117.1 hypothetical protein SNE26_24190 [Mucilaginibacter gossypii]
MSSEVYILTPDMFLVSKGLLYQTVTWLGHHQIKDYQIHDSKWMAYLGIVDLTIISTEDLQIRCRVKGVGNNAMRNAFNTIIDLLEMRKEYFQSLIDLAEKLNDKQS